VRAGAVSGGVALLLLILASASAARLAMLRQAGVKCFCMPAALDEAAVKRGFEGEPEGLALALAHAKAAEVAVHYPDALVIGADQILICEGERFDKPVGLAGAAAQLRRLRGRTHELITAVSVHRGAAAVWAHVGRARLTMRALSESFIEDYLRVEGEAVCGAVGAYRIEGLGVQLFEQVEGDYFTILGLPMLPLLGFLRDAGALAG
jgi:septum formation protein